MISDPVQDLTGDVLYDLYDFNGRQPGANIGYVRKNYTVTYNANLPDGASLRSRVTLPDAQTFSTWGRVVRIKDLSGRNSYNRDAQVSGENKYYKFLGWAETSDATTAEYTPGQYFSVVRNTTLYAVWERNDKDVMYFVLMPGIDAPSNGADQGYQKYYPNKTSEDDRTGDDGGVSGCTTYTGYTGGNLTEAGFSAVPTEGNSVVDLAGQYSNSTYLSVPSNLGYFNANTKTEELNLDMTGKEIVWYVIKNQEDGYHVDGYVKNVPIKVRYHENFNGDIDVKDTVTDIVSGGTVIVKTAGAVFGEDYTHEGYTFAGWSTSQGEDGTVYQPGNQTEQLVTSLDLYAKWTKTDPNPDPIPGSSTLVPAMFFINLGGKDDSNPNGIGTFTDKIEIPNALNKTTFEDHLDNSMGSNRGFIFNIEGVKKVQGCEDNKLLITEPDIDTINQRITAKGKNDMTVGGNTGREVVWYHVSHCGDGYHVDGYVKGVPITLTYHENFGTSDAQTVIDKNTSGTTLNSGDKVAIQSYNQVFTDEATQHQGWTFAGWFTANNQEYEPGETTLIDSVDLYAKWKKTYTVNFIGNGGVWDSSVSGYTMTTDKNSKNIKATKTITVTPTTESTATVSKIATNPTKDKYDFLGWSKTIGGPIITENEWATMKPGETTTIDFYANWKAKQDPIPDTVNYTINKHFKNNKGTTIKDVSGNLTPGTKNATLGSLITSDEVKQIDGENKYVYVPGETTFKMGGQPADRNTPLTREATIDLYYYLDNWKDADEAGKDSENGGDNIPDCYQVLVKYQSGDLIKGKIADNARTQEVLTIRVDKQPANKGTVTASGSTATATGSRCYFVNWTNKDNTQVGPKATLGELPFDAVGGETYTFTANFDRSSGGGGGGSNRPKPPVVEIPDDVPTGLNGKDHYAYIIGYGNNDVRPQNNITRAEVATIFFRLLTDETREANMTKSNGYNDVKDGDWFCCAVSTLSKMGIIKGYEDGSFKPNDPISRAEFAAIAARFDPDGDKTPASFFDVTSHWAKDEISIAANHGWIKGYEDGSFKPDQKITRAETMTLVNRVLNRLPETKDDLHKDMKTWVDNMDETAWYYLAVQEATNSHYFKNKTSTKFEQWTDLRDTRDWSELEK